MKQISLLFYCALLLGSLSCFRQTTVNVKYNGMPLEGAGVQIPVSKNKTAVTNSLGDAYFRVRKKRHNKDAQLRVLHDQLTLDTIFLLPLRSLVPIALADPAIPKLRQHILQDDILPKLNQADSLLNEIEREVNAYVRLHPDANVEEYKKAIGYRREELAQLKTQVKDLYKRYDKVIQDMDDGDVEDFSDAEIEFAKARDKSSRFLNLTRKTYEQGKQVLSCDPDTDLETDIFFDPGEFETGNLSYEGKRDIREFYEKINTCLNSAVFRGKKGVKISVSAIGFTDGIPCGPTTLNRMASTQECSNLNTDNGNLCLSRLRAKSIRSQITDLIPPEYIVVGTYRGEGSRLARNEKDNRASLRKCKISFSINTDEIMKKYD